MQEINFFEEGEPMIDGEPGDLKVEMFDCLQCTITLGLSSDSKVAMQCRYLYRLTFDR